MSRTQRLAVLLAIGAVGWGIFCALVIVAVPAFAIVFASGYILTAGYLWMAFGSPHPGWRRLIWAYSALIQGAWLAWAVVTMDRDAQGIEVLWLSWWAFAFLASAHGFVAEPERYCV